jgi:hypothetical protein
MEAFVSSCLIYSVGRPYWCARQGCQIFLDTIYRNDKKAYQITIKFPNDHLSFYGPPKFTQIGNFGLKKYHLATLVQEQQAQFV